MKFLALPLLALALTAGTSQAGITPGAGAPKPDTRPVAAVRAMMTHCLPAVAAAEPIADTALSPLSPAQADRLLGKPGGQVWLGNSGVLIAADARTPFCRVIAPDIDPAVMTDLILTLFTGAGTPFRQQRFRLDPGGGFAAVFTAPSRRGRVVFRLSAAQNAAGRYVAVLGVELDRPIPSPPRSGSSGQ